MAFIFIRHLPTAYNQQGLLQGQCNVPILAINNTPNNTTKLQQEIIKNRQKLEQFSPFKSQLCSQLIRTKQTAQAYDFNTTPEPLLNELNFGIYEGKPRQLMLDEIGEQWYNDPYHLHLGEPVSALLQRVRAFYQKYQHQNGNVLAFAHGAWLRAAYTWAQQGTIQNMNKNQSLIPNNALLVIDFNRTKE